MQESEFEQLVLQYVQRAKYTPVKSRILARNLEIPKPQHASFKALVKQMVRDGKLSYGENHKIQPADGAPSGNEVIGKFQRKAGGFGFIRPRGAKPGSRDSDVYVSARNTLDATSGDLVRARVRMTRRGRDLKFSGEIWWSQLW